MKITSLNKIISDKTKYIVLTTIIFVMIGLLLIIKTSYSYKYESSLKMINSNVASQPGNDIIVNVYYEDVLTNTTVVSGAILDNYNCTAGATADYNSTTGQITISNISVKTTCNIYLKSAFVSQLFSYTEETTIFNVPVTGTYKIELWGAQGGNGYSTYLRTAYSYGGGGAYVSGNITLNKGDILYFNVGQQGTNTLTTKSYIGYNAGGWNGGARGRSHNNNNTYVHNGAGGGGATDVRYGGTELLNRIMVAAAGGGGGGHEGNATGGVAGGLTSFSVRTPSSQWDTAGAASQTAGGTRGTGGQNNTNAYSGTLGVGGNCATNYGGGGGGGGYYGGAGGSWAPGSGGSSFISGHNGCNALNSSGTHSGTANHFSGKVFTDTVMIDGGGRLWTTVRGSATTMPKPNGGTYTSGTGHTGNGYAIITLIS